MATSAQERRPRALAEIGLNALQTDFAFSSDEDLPRDPGRQDASDALSIVGVSLGPEQSRLVSPSTPAAEKSRAIEDGGGFFESTNLASLEEADEDQDDGQDDTVNGSQRQGRTTGRAEGPSPRLPSPWRAGPKVFQKPEASRSFFRDNSLPGLRRRSSSTAALSATLDQWHRALLATFPKSLTMPSPFSSSKASLNQSKSSSPGPDETRQSPSSSVPRTSVTRLRSRSEAASTEAAIPPTTATIPDHHPALERTSMQSRRSHLRRSASDQSLQPHRTMSRASTLGDDSRFEDVSAQVNSRLKAIKDSFQDSNFRVPSLPSLPSFSLESLRPDFAYSAKNGFHKRSSTAASNTSSPSMSQTRLNAHAVGDPADGGATFKAAVSHPHFTKACARLTGDVVILGGYRGSILRSAEPPNRQLWVPVKVGLNIRKVDMEVGLSVPEDDANMEAKIIPGGMLSHIGPVDISRRLFRRLRACSNHQSGRLRVHDYGYDWRLDPQYLSDRLIAFLERLPCNLPGVPRSERGATVIAHSLGGLITRHAINRRPDLFAGVVYAGTPTTCVNILGPLRNGDDVLLSSRVLTAQVNFTIRTSFALLPLNGRCFFNKASGEYFDVDFFDPQTWIDYCLSPCVARPLPSLKAPASGILDNLKSTITSSLPKRASLSLPSRSAPPAQNPTSPNEGSNTLSHLINHHPSPNTGGTEASRGLELSEMDHAPSSSVATAVTLPREQCIAYLTTVLARVKQFKEELDFHPPHKEGNTYPPAAVIYGKSTPTVYGAKVVDRESIKRADAYDDLAFGSGDGVVLAKAAMLPDGYDIARGGRISSERGHITLLGDLEAVGRALNAVRRAREKGVGQGAR